MSGIADSIKGKIKEVAGKVSGDKRTESEGQTDQVKAKAKQAADDVSERAKGVADSLEEETRDTQGKTAASGDGASAPGAKSGKAGGGSA